MSQYGQIIAVETRAEGDEVVGAHAAGALSLQLGDAGAFDPAGGIASTPLGTLVYTAADAETGVLTLASALPAGGLADGDRVELWDSERGAVSTTMVAFVLLEGDDDSGDPAECDVPQYLRPYIPEGTRAEPGEVVEVVISADGTAVVIDIPGREPLMDGTMIDPATLPGDTAPTEPPAASPAIEVRGLAESLIVTAEAVEASTLIIYEIAPDSAGAPGTWEQIGDPTRALVQIITNLPSTGAKLDPAATYWVRATATNGVLPNPAPSTALAGQLDPTAVNDLVAAALVVGLVMAGEIRIGSITLNPDTGITVPQPGGKSIVFPTDGSRARLEGPGVDADELTVAGQSVFQGPRALSAEETLNSTVAAPKTAPGIINDWPGLTATGLDPSDPGPTGWRGLCDNVAGDRWLTTMYTNGRYWVVQIDKTTGAVAAYTALPNDIGGQVGGITRIGSTYWIAQASQLRPLDSSFALQAGSIPVPTEDSGYPDAVGFKGSDILHGRKLLNGNLRIRRYTAAGALVSTHTVTAANSGGDTPPMGNVLSGAHGYASSMYTVAKEGTGDVRVIDEATLGAQSTLQFPPAGSVEQRGLWWDGTRFWGLGKNGKVYQYATDQSAASVSATQSLTDGTAETAVGPASAAVTRKKRAWLKLTAASPPISPAGLSGRIYVGTSTRYRQTPSPALTSTNLSGFVDVLATSIAAPSSQSGTFASGGLGKIRAAAGGFEVDGASGGSVGTGGFRDSVIAAPGVPVEALNTTNTEPNGTTNTTLPGMSITIASPGTSAKFSVEIDADINYFGSQINIIELLVDGTPEAAQLVTQGVNGVRYSAHKRWFIEGLSAGNHTLTARTRNTAAGSNARIMHTHTKMIAGRRVG